MTYKVTKSSEIPHAEKFGINLNIYPDMANCGVVIVDTETGHNEEFYNKRSTFHYIILEGSGDFFLDDEKVSASTGDLVSIAPKTRIYYRGKMKMVLVTSPAWREGDEVETKASIW